MSRKDDYLESVTPVPDRDAKRGEDAFKPEPVILSPEEKKWFMAGVFKSTILIYLAYAIGFGIVIGLMVLFIKLRG